MRRDPFGLTQKFSCERIYAFVCIQEAIFSTALGASYNCTLRDLATHYAEDDRPFPASARSVRMPFAGPAERYGSLRKITFAATCPICGSVSSSPATTPSTPGPGVTLKVTDEPCSWNVPFSVH